MKTTLRLIIAIILVLTALATNLVAQTPRPHTVTLNYQHPDPAVNFTIYRADKDCATVVAADWKKLASSVVGLTYTDTGVMAGKYCYAVAATKLNNESAKSVPTSPTVIDIDPPSNVTYTVDLVLTGKLTLIPQPNGVQKASVDFQTIQVAIK